MSKNLLDSKPGRSILEGATERLTPSARRGVPAAEAGLGTSKGSTDVLPGLDQVSDADATQCLRPSAVAKVRPVQRVEGYEILSELGRGGMGVVFKAWQHSLQRNVALKMVLAGSFAAAQDLNRFHAEAMAIARLHHPHLVSIYEIGESNHLPFYAMEYMEGGTLARRLNGQPIAPRVAAGLVRSLAQAVDYAHKNGIVHRDLKPGNILLAGDPETPLENCVAKITDFGIAKHLHDTNSYTRTGDILGTPHYMAPEQATGKPGQIGPAADVYSLGAILYELLTGRSPFHGHEGAAVLLKLAKEEPERPTTWVRNLPRDLETICLKSLEKDPAKRYGSAGALADDLTRYLQNEPILAKPSSLLDRGVKWSRRRPALAAILLMTGAAAVLAFAMMVMMWRQAVDNAVEQEANLRRQHDLLQQSRAQLADAYLERGNHLAERGDVRRGMHWMLRALELTDGLKGQPKELAPIIRMNIGAWGHCVAAREITLPHSDWVWDSVFTPDRKFVITASRDTHVQVWDVRNGQAIGAPLVHPHGAWGVAIQPDGKTLFTIYGDASAKAGGLCVWSADPKRPGQFVPRGKPVQVPHDLMRLQVNKAVDRLWVGSYLDGRSYLYRFDANAPGNGLEQIEALKGPHIHAAFSGDGATLATIVGTVEPIALERPTAPESWFALAPVLSLREHIKYKPYNAQPTDAVQLWNGRTGAAVGDPLIQPGPVRALAFNKDGSHLFIGSATKYNPDQGEASIVHTWDVVARQRISQTPPLQGRIKTMAVAPSGQMLAVSFFDFVRPKYQPGIQVTDGHIALWQMRDKGAIESFGTPLRTTHVVWSMEFSPDSRLLLAGCENSAAYLWSVANSQLLLPPIWHEGTSVKVAFNPDGRQAITASAGGTSYAAARLWDVPSFAHIGPSMSMYPGVPSTVWCADGRHAWIAGNRVAARWDVLTGEKKEEFIFPEFVLSAHPTDKPGILMIEFAQSKFRLFDTATRELRPMPNRPDQAPNGSALDVYPKCDTMFEYWGKPARFQLLKLDGASRSRMVSEPEYELAAYRLSPQGDCLAVAQSVLRRSSRLVLYDPKDDLRVRHVIPCQHPINCINFSPDGKTLAFGGVDRQVQRLDAGTAKLIGSPLLHESIVHWVSYVQGNRLLVTQSGKGLFLVWDTETGKRIGPAFPHETGIFSAGIRSDGKYLLTTTYNKIAMTWRLPEPVEGSLADVRLWVETKTDMEMDERETIVPIDPVRLAEKRRRLADSGYNPYAAP